MRRWSSFCSAELPSSVINFDLYFDIIRPIPSPPPPAPRLTRSHSIGRMMPKYYELPQVDGPSERRKAKKKQQKQKKKKGKSNNHGNASNSNSNDKPHSQPESSQQQEESQRQAEPQQEQEELKREIRSSSPPYSPPESVSGLGVEREEEGQGMSDTDTEAAAATLQMMRSGSGSGAGSGFGSDPGHGPGLGPLVVDGSVIDAGQEPEGGDSSSGYHRASLGSSEGTMQMIGIAVEETANQLHCQFHGRAKCQFDVVCCVHQPVAGCGCPPNRSCCCVHHPGDCCSCLYALPAASDAGKAPPAGLSSSPMERGDLGHFDKRRGTPSVDGDDQGEGEGETDEERDENHEGEGNIDLTLSAYFVNLLERSELCDYRFVLRSSDDLFWPLVFNCHRVLLARSPLIHTLFLHNPAYLQRGEMVAIAGDHFCTIKSFELVLQYLYGRPLLKAADLKPITLVNLGYDANRPQETGYPFSLQAAMADMALCYASCGAFFHLSQVVETGFALAIDLLSWDTVEVILYFGVCINQFSVTLDPTTPVPSPGPSRTSGTSSATPSPTPATTATEGGEGQENLTFPPGEIQLPWSPHLITAALSFIIDHITPEFTLYASAQGVSLPDRIPEELRFPTPPPAPPNATTTTTTTLMALIPGSVFAGRNPRLANVKLGSFETEATVAAQQEEQKRQLIPPGPEVVVPSAVLIGLPFLQLQVAFAMMTSRKVLGNRLARAIVLEREARRVRALKAWRNRVLNLQRGRGSGSARGKEMEREGKSKSVGKKKEKEKEQEKDADGDMPKVVRELGYREFFTSKVVDTVEMEITLEREWVGLD